MHILIARSYMHRRETVVIADTQTTRIGVVRKTDNLSNGRHFVRGNCAVEGILRLYLLWSKIWGVGVSGVKVSGGSFGIGGYGESTSGVGWVRRISEELRESYAAETILKGKKEVHGTKRR